MKTLIVQLARLGDIYLTWPVARALKRVTGGEVHYLVRPRFQSALNGVGAVDKVYTLPTEKLVSPLLTEKFDLESSLNELDDFYEQLQNEGYDQIINLSFSPASSFLVSSIATANTRIAGYTRHADGYLNLSDDVSRYFWAQVGLGFPNRLHLVDLFGGLAGVDYAVEDFREPMLVMNRTVTKPYMVLHIGASESHKHLKAKQWKNLIEHTSAIQNIKQWVIVGSADEKSMAQEIENSFSPGMIINKVGQTQIEELFGLIKYADGVIGCDSVAMHMATFVNQKAFCISTSSVKFWETAPITLGSAVYTIGTCDAFDGVQAAKRIQEWLKNDFTNLIEVVEEVPRFKAKNKTTESEEFAWNLIRAIYMSAPFPMTSDIAFYRGCLRLFEANSVAQQNLRKRAAIEKNFLTSVLDRVDEIFMAVTNQVPTLMPLFRWYQAEKTRIQPGTFEQIAQDTEVIHQVFAGLLKKYLLEEDVRKVERDGNL